MSYIIKSIAKFCLAALIPFHMLAIAWTTIIPLFPYFPQLSKNVLYKKVNGVFDPYLISTGNAQRWNLFTSLPDIHNLDAIVEVVDNNGVKYHFDPVLPGLKELNTNNLRELSLFLRFMYGMNEYIEPYMQKVITAIDESGHIEIKEAYLIINQRRTRYLDNIRKDRLIYYSDPGRYGPYKARQ